MHLLLQLLRCVYFSSNISHHQREHSNSTSLHQNSINVTSDTAAARQQRLEVAERGMGLTMPRQGILAPTLGFDLACFQMHPNNGGNAAPGRITPCQSVHAAAGCITSRESGHTTPQEMGSEFMSGVGINPPHLPGNDFLHQGATAGVNLGFCSLDAATSCQQPLMPQAASATVLFFQQATAPGIQIRWRFSI